MFPVTTSKEHLLISGATKGGLTRHLEWAKEEGTGTSSLVHALGQLFSSVFGGSGGGVVFLKNVLKQVSNAFVSLY